MILRVSVESILENTFIHLPQILQLETFSDCFFLQTNMQRVCAHTEMLQTQML